MTLSHLLAAFGGSSHRKLGRKARSRIRRRMNNASRPIIEAVEQRVLMSTSIWNTSYDFEGTTPNTSGWSTSTVHTSNAITGWASTKYLVGPSTLTLSSLPAHMGATVSFDIYALDKWDGGSGAQFTLTANGVSKIDVSLANDWNNGDDATGTLEPTSNTQSNPSAYNNAANAARTGAVATGEMDSDGENITSYSSCTTTTDDDGDSDDCGGGDCGCGGGGGSGDDDDDAVTTTTYTEVSGNINDGVYHYVIPVADAQDTLALAFSGPSSGGAFFGIDNVKVDLAVPEAPGGNSNGNGVDLFTGAAGVSVDGPSSGGFGAGFDSSSFWGNGDAGSNSDGSEGNGSIQSDDLPRLLQDSSGATIIGQRGQDFWWWDNSGGSFTERYGGVDSLTYDGTNTQYIVTEEGAVATFYDFSHGSLSGHIKSLSDADGNGTTLNYNGSSQLTSVVRENVTGTVHTKQAFTYTYLTSGTNTGKISTIVEGNKTWDTGLGQSEPGSYTTSRQTAQTYYDTGDTGGTPGDLELVQTKDGSGNVLDSQYMRYYISGDSDTHGYVGAIKYVLNTESYARLVAGLSGSTTPATATDAQIAVYADQYFQYNSQHQVSETITQGSGSSSASSVGLGTTTYSFAASGTGGGSYNIWTNKTTVVDPSDTTSTTYFNGFGQTMLTVTSDGTNFRGNFNEYDSSGRVILTAAPSAVSISSLSSIEQYPDLLHSVSGNYADLNDSAGLISTTSYYSSTTANSTTAGGVAGYVSDTYVKQGETGTAIHQSNTTYFQFSASGDVVSPVAASTTYGNADGSDARTTTYAYTMYSGTVQPKLETVTSPGISTGQNGPGTGSPDTNSSFNDIYGRTIWTKDGDGHVNYTGYDQATGAVIKTITDVDYSSLSGAEQTSFGLTGWSNPSGLNLVTTYVVDSLGRTIETTDPAGKISFSRYNDTGYESRSYPGWQSVSGTATSSGSTTTIICTTLTGADKLYIGQSVLVTGGTDSGQQAVVTGWNASTHTLTFSPAFSSATTTSTAFIVAGTTGPIQISLQYRAAANSTNWSYSESISIAAAPHLASDGTPDGTESITSSNIAALSRSFVNAAGQTICSDSYFDFTGLTYSQTVGTSSGMPADIGTAGTNFYRTTYGYDTAGRQNKTVSPTGTITRTVFDALGRKSSTWIGTTDTHTGSEWTPSTNTGNMIKVEDDVYDSGGVGDGNLTQVTQHVDTSSGDDRVTQSLFDFEDRQVASKSGIQSSESDGTHRPISFNVLDNMGETLRAYQFDGDAVALSDFSAAALTDAIPTADASKVRALTVNSFDDQGRNYRTQVFDIDQTNGTSGLSDASILALANLQTDTFYNHRGQSTAVFSPGGQVQKSVYDGGGRVTTQYTTDGGAVNNSNAQQKDWTHAGSVSSDVVLTQTENTLDADGNTILTTTRDRFHDDSTSSEGGLGTPTSGIHARVSYMASYFDAANRLTDSVNVGTNGGSAYTRPSTVPTASDTVLVTHTDYNGAGNAYLITDPRGIYSESFFDMLNRTLETIDDSTLGSPATGSQITDSTYDGANHILTMKAIYPGTSSFQTTQYIYGIGGTSGTNLFSNDILLKTEFPNASTGSPDTTAAGSASYTYDLLGEQLTVTDQNGNVHTLTDDVLGRVILDAVTTLGSGVDGSIRAHGTTFTGLGLPYQVTAYSNSSATTVVNQIQNVYNGFGDLITQYQEHSGSVNTSTSQKVQYSYAEGSGNTDRLTSMTYPNGRVLDYGYSTGIDANISRLSYLKDDAGTSAGVHLEEYSYLGLSTIVIRNRPENNTELTYVQQSGDANAITDGGDQYTGLDRFDRVIDQFWKNTSSGATIDRIQQAYDRDGNVLYQNNLVNSAFSELFHGNSSTSNDNLTAYDNLNRLNAYRRGTLTASGNNGSGVLDTVTTGNLNTLASSSQSWTLDALGNWSSLTTDGTATSRTHNSKNEVAAVGSNSLTFDNNGNTTVDQNGKHYVYDAWNQLITLKDTNNTTVLLSLTYDALHNIIVYNNGSAGNIYHDSLGRWIESHYSLVHTQLVWAGDYLNDLILRDRNADNSTSTGGYGLSGSGLEERLYAQHDANWDVTSVLDTSAAVQLRYTYTPYGAVTTMDGTWATYDDSSTIQWAIKWQGERYEGTGDFYFMGARLYSPGLGRFMQQDPSGYSDGANLFESLADAPIEHLDPTGLTIVKQKFSDIMHPVTKDDFQKQEAEQAKSGKKLPAALLNWITVGLAGGVSGGWQSFKIFVEGSWNDETKDWQVHNINIGKVQVSGLDRLKFVPGSIDALGVGVSVDVESTGHHDPQQTAAYWDDSAVYTEKDDAEWTLDIGTGVGSKGAKVDVKAHFVIGRGHINVQMEATHLYS
jgi:RHS repeat-associated protein